MTEKAEEQRTLYLVDGTAQVFRAYFAIHGLSTRDGVPTNAIYGFTATLRKLIRDRSPGYMAVAFDTAAPTFRHERYEEYKANRPEPPEDLVVQFPYARKVCEALNIPVLERPGYEADDLIATFTRLGREAGFDVVVVASDKDLLQLVGEGVVSFNPGKNLELDASGVEDSFGVPPEHVRDVLALMGDAVDNIPGVPGVGEKTAKAMVRTYGGMDPVLERAERFVTAYDARDAALVAVDALQKAEEVESGQVREAEEALERMSAAMAALAEFEADEEMRVRLEEARDLPAGHDTEAWREGIGKPGKGLGTSLRPIRKVLKGLDRKSGKKVWYSVCENRESAVLSRELATLDDDVPVDLDPGSLVLADPDREEAAALFRALEFRTLAEEFSAPEGAGEPPPVPAGEEAYRAVLDEKALREEAGLCRRAGRFAVDTETDGIDPMRAALVGISLSREAGKAVYIPVGHDYEGAARQLGIEPVREILGPILADPAVGKIGQNIKYDMHVLRRHGMPVEGIEQDTMVAAFLLNAGRSSYKMDALSEEYLGHTTIPYTEVAGTGSEQKTLNLVDIEAVTRYAAEDADITLRLADLFASRLKESGLDELYGTMDGPLLPVLAAMEARGIRIDPELLSAMSGEMAASIDRLRGEIHDLAGRELNLDSPKQLREVLFDELGLKPRRKTAKGKVPSTDARTLEELASEHPIAPAILEYRELAKLKGTYVDTLPRLIHPGTGRVHTSYNPAGAATGRLSSSDPNLQNIPARSQAGLRIREAFVPGEGCLFVAADYSQMELRVLAHMCGDPELIAAFRSGEDIHRHTAAKVFGVAPELVAPEMRRRAKAVNFGILYGMSEMRLAREQEISRKEARSFIETYFDLFRQVREYIEQVREDAVRDAAVRTLFGRIRYFPQLHQRIARPQREQALRAAVNTTIQGTAADLMKLAMLRVDEALAGEGLESRILLQVHDELLLEVPEEEKERAAELVRREMEQVHPLEVPLSVDVKTGANWRQVT